MGNGLLTSTEAVNPQSNCTQLRVSLDIGETELHRCHWLFISALFKFNYLKHKIQWKLIYFQGNRTTNRF